MIDEDKFQKQYWERKTLEKRRTPVNKVIRSYVLPKIKEIRKQVDINENTTLLDVGAGSGAFSFWFDKICKTTAIDYSSHMTKLNPIKNKLCMDAQKMTFIDNNFDIVFCHAFLHHIDNIQAVLKEMKRVSKKYIVIMEPNRNNPAVFLFSLIVKEERLALKFSLKYLKEQIKKADLEIISAYPYGLMTPNKCPAFLLPILKLFNRRFFLGITNIAIAKKKN
ncbi:MAG: class I SAM-dependent methyltransferase [Patescibacteria group bacterium]